MPLHAHIIDDSPVLIWGLTSRQRKIRVLNGAGVTDIVDDIAAVPENSSVLLLRGDYLFDDRVINYLVQTPDIILEIPREPTGVLVAAHVGSGQAAEAREAIVQNRSSGSPAGVEIETLETLSVSFQQRLLKFQPPFVLPIHAENARILDRRYLKRSSASPPADPSHTSHRRKITRSVRPAASR